MKKANLSQSQEPAPAAAKPHPQAKRYDDAFKRQAVEHWLRSGKFHENAAMESFLATHKQECIALAEEQGGYAIRAEAQGDAFAYFETYYNRTRLHSALGYPSPVDSENRIN
jgi:transposase InsO family protein